MKFGGTSVGDAACIRRAAEIVKSAAAHGPVVVVVSAMSGVTNRLIKGAHRAQADIYESIRELRHYRARLFAPAYAGHSGEFDSEL